MRIKLKGFRRKKKIVSTRDRDYDVLDVCEGRKRSVRSDDADDRILEYDANEAGDHRRHRHHHHRSRIVLTKNARPRAFDAKQTGLVEEHFGGSA